MTDKEKLQKIRDKATTQIRAMKEIRREDLTLSVMAEVQLLAKDQVYNEILQILNEEEG